MAKDWVPNQTDRDRMARDLQIKADWHAKRAGGRANASLERAGQLHYRAETARVGIPHPDRPDVKHIKGRAVEPESKPRAGRPSPADFAWR